MSKCVFVFFFIKKLNNYKLEQYKSFDIGYVSVTRGLGTFSTGAAAGAVLIF